MVLSLKPTLLLLAMVGVWFCDARPLPKHTPCDLVRLLLHPLANVFIIKKPAAALPLTTPFYFFPSPSFLFLFGTCQPGEQGKNTFSSRMKRSLDYQLCKKRKGLEKYCEKCICTWTYYYEAASLCFKSDPEYKARVKEEQQVWNDDSLTYCNRQAMEFSLDPKQDNYCGAATRINVPPSIVLLVLGVFAFVATM